MSNSDPGAESHIRVFGVRSARRVALLMGTVALCVAVLGAVDMAQGGAGLITGPLLILPGLFYTRHAYHLLRAAQRHAEPRA